METPVDGSQDQTEASPAFKAGVDQIQISSISIEISSTDINEPVVECDHFSMRGYVAEVRKTNSALCSPFLSDGDVNGSDTQPYELPPLDTRKFRWWRCNACLKDCNSAQGTSKDIGIGKSVPSQSSGKQSCLRGGGRSRGLSNLYASAAANGIIIGSSSSSQRSDKGKQVQDGGCAHEMLKGNCRDPLFGLGNSQGTHSRKSKGKRLLLNDAFQGPSKKKNTGPLTDFSISRGSSFQKSINEAVMVPFNGLNYEKAPSSRKSDKQHQLEKGGSSRVTPKGAMGPPPKPSKDQNFLKSASSKQMPKEFAMPPPGGFSNGRQNSHTSGKGSRLKNQSSFGGVSKDSPLLPLNCSAIGKSTHAGRLSKQKNVQQPKSNARLYQKGDSSTAAPLYKKRNYAKRSVQQPQSTGDKQEIQKGGENGLLATSNRETLQDGAAKEDGLLIPERLNDGKVPLQLNKNVEVGSCSKSTVKISNLLTAGRTPDSACISLLEHSQFAKDGETCPDKDGADKSINSVRPSSSRQFKKPNFDDGLEPGKNDVYEEEEDDEYRGSRLRKTPKIRLLSDVIAKYPTNVRGQPDNSKVSTGAFNEIVPVKSVAAKAGEPSSKRKVSPVASRDTSNKEVASDKDTELSSKTTPIGSHDTPAGGGAPLPGGLKKRKRSPQDVEEHLTDSVIGGSKRSSVRFAELENKVVHNAHPMSGVDDSPETVSVQDANKQSKPILDRAEVEKKSKKAKIQNAVSSPVPSEPRQESRDNCDRVLDPDRYSLGEVAIPKPPPVPGGSVTDGGIEESLKIICSVGKPERVEDDGKRNSFLQGKEDCQPGNKIVQFGLNNVDDVQGDDTFDCVITGSGFSKRSNVAGNVSNSFTPLSNASDNYLIDGLTAEELWFPQVQPGGALVERRSGESSSYAQQKEKKTSEAKGRLKDIDINSIPVDDKTPEQGSADDIPMEIVELLAKHQYERRCEANRERLNLPEPNGESSAQKTYPSMLKPHASYAGSGFGKQFEAMGNGNQLLSDHFETSQKNVRVGYPKEDSLCPQFGVHTQTHGHYPTGAQYSCSVPTLNLKGNTSVQIRDASHGMLQQSPMPQQPMQPFSGYQGGMSLPLSNQIWPPIIKSGIPLTGLANQGLYTQGADMLHNKGKEIRGPINFNFERATIGNPGSSSSQPWSPRIAEYAGGRHKSAEYVPANESIPAMQLLNLVHVVGTSRGNTPPLNQDTEYLQPQYAPGPRFGPYNKAAASSSRQKPYEWDGRTSTLDQRSTLMLTSPSAYQNELAIATNSRMKSPYSYSSSLDQRNNNSLYNALSRDFGSDNPSSQAFRAEKKRKHTSAGGNPALGYGYPVSGNNALQPIRVAATNIMPPLPFNDGEYCSTNRNPAEFLDMEAAESFYLRPEHLRRAQGLFDARSVLPSSRPVPNAKMPLTILNGKGCDRLHIS